MIFRRGPKRPTEETDPPEASEEELAAEEDAVGADRVGEDRADEDRAGEDRAGEDGAEEETDLTALDELDWRRDGPWDITEVDLEQESELPRIDLGAMVVTGFPGAELRLQIAEDTQQIQSALLIRGDSALELGAYAAPRSGGRWPELREEIIEGATSAGGSASLAEGPFGVELRRLLPVTTPDGSQGYQPSRMWVVEGPRWLLRGIVYGQAALEDGVEPPVADLLTAFRQVVVRRGDQAMAPGDLLPLQLPEDVAPAE
ncbi:MAG: DUF3710 domain-containing protein [Actinomycetes bacterium]